MNERTHFFIKIYLSHFIRKGWCFLCVRGELETETDCHILTPSSSDHSSTSFAFWLGCSTMGPEGQALFLVLVLTLPSYLQLELQLELQLTQAVSSTWLYNCLTYTCFLWAYASAPNSTTSAGQGIIPTSSTGFTCLSVLLLIYIGASLDWRLGRGPIYNTCFVFSREPKHEILGSGITVVATFASTIPVYTNVSRNFSCTHLSLENAP